MGRFSARFLIDLVISILVAITSLLLGVQPLVLAPLAVGYIASLILGIDLIALGYLFSIVAGVALDMGYSVFLLLSAIVAHVILGYLYIRIPRELLRISVATITLYIAFIASFYPIALYARIVSAISGIQEWFPLGSIVAISILILTMGIIRSDIDISGISDPLISRGETIYRAIPFIARIVTVLACLGGSIAYRDPALLLTMIAGFAIERIVGKVLNSWELKPLVNSIALFIVYIYIILRAY
jgi:hypothetical protein